ncbi:MAG TPA: hypothetical protein VMH38_04120 [Thermoplasmata archaeon]|nr:hypothetical protein [Thermoplasmata archaeon]
MSIGSTNTSYQGSQTTTVSQVPGLTWVNTSLTELTTTEVAGLTTGCTVAGACDITDTGVENSFSVCAGAVSPLTCSASDFVENVTLSAGSVAFPVNTVALTTYVTGPVLGTLVGPTLYFTELNSFPTTAQTIVLYFDIGNTTSGPGVVTSVSVIATT